MAELPNALWFPHPDFGELFDERHSAGLRVARNSQVAFVGLARNCGQVLRNNLELCARVGRMFRGWQLHVESNDCVDDTLDVLASFCRDNRQATFHYEDLGRPHCPAEFAGRRTIALAEYRDACQRWVRACAPEADYVVVVDLDLWAGFSVHGFMNSIGWLLELPGAYGMASVSLFQHDWGHGAAWQHYDLWALRGVGQADCYWDTYRGGLCGFGYSWMPAVGSPPALVSSAFGGLSVYRAADYLRGTYDGTADCEHVAFHRSIARTTGKHLYVCPAMRTIVRWVESSDAGDGVNSVPSISGDVA